MTNATIFNSAEDTPATQQSATTDASLFQALVGDEQKYKTPEDLAKAYANADQFIETLKEENRVLRDKVAQAQTIDDVLERITTQGNAPLEDEPTVSGITPEDVQQLVVKTLRGEEANNLKTKNLLLADQLLKNQYGDKAIDVFRQRANTPEKQRIMMELAAADPQEFANLFGTTAVVTNTMDTGSMNTTSVASSGRDRSNVEWTKEWTAKVRKDNPNQYWSQEFQFKLQQSVTKNPALYFGQ